MSGKRVLSVTHGKCSHINEKKIISLFRTTDTVQDVFEENHPPLDPKHFLYTGNSSCGEVSLDVPVGDIVDVFKISALNLQCKTHPEHELHQEVTEVLQEATKKATDAFQILMSGGREFVKKSMCVENVYGT